jgi:hypothetical protein
MFRFFFRLSSGSVKCGEFLDYLMTCWLLNKDSAPWTNNNRLLLVIWSLVSLLCCSFTHWQSLPNHHVVVSITVSSSEISDIKRNCKPSPSCLKMWSISLRVFSSKEVKMYFWTSMREHYALNHCRFYVVNLTSLSPLSLPSSRKLLFPNLRTEICSIHSYASKCNNIFLCQLGKWWSTCLICHRNRPLNPHFYLQCGHVQSEQ